VKVLVVQGAGMNMRGKVDLNIFGPMTLEQLNDEIRAYATELGIDVEFCHSNIEGEVVNALYAAHDGDVDAALINPAGFGRTTGPLPTAIGQVRFPVIEVHVSNPVARGSVSTILPTCRGSVTGFGPYSYYLALAGLKQIAMSSSPSQPK
jgi:3-dehydroquinate dehydratase II